MCYFGGVLYLFVWGMCGVVMLVMVGYLVGVFIWNLFMVLVVVFLDLFDWGRL